ARSSTTPSASGACTESRSSAPRRTVAAARSPSGSASARKPPCGRPSGSATATSTASSTGCWRRSGPAERRQTPRHVRFLVRRRPLLGAGLLLAQFGFEPGKPFLGESEDVGSEAGDRPRKADAGLPLEDLAERHHVLTELP